MQLVDINGDIYSSKGLRFGGFPTALFLALTGELEELTPGVQDRIITEAHYLALWLHKFPEIAFFFGILYTHSISTAFLFFTGAFFLELFRFRVFGASPLISYVCRFWDWFKWPIFLGAAMALWPANRFISIILIIFIAIEGIFGIASMSLLAVVRIIAGSLAYHGFWGKARRPWILYMEGLALQYVVDRWRMKLLPPKEALKFYETSKDDIEFYELNSKESYMRAYANRPFFNIVVSYLWLQSVGGLIFVAYYLIIRNFVAVILSLFATVIALVLFFILHEWALRHPEQTGDKKK